MAGITTGIHVSDNHINLSTICKSHKIITNSFRYIGIGTIKKSTVCIIKLYTCLITEAQVTTNCKFQTIS